VQGLGGSGVVQRLLQSTLVNQLESSSPWLLGCWAAARAQEGFASPAAPRQQQQGSSPPAASLPPSTGTAGPPPAAAAACIAGCAGSDPPLYCLQYDVMVTAGANQAFTNVVLALLDASDRVALFK
jgi:hypothetical protein